MADSKTSIEHGTDQLDRGSPADDKSSLGADEKDSKSEQLEDSFGAAAGVSSPVLHVGPSVSPSDDETPHPTRRRSRKARKEHQHSLEALASEYLLELDEADAERAATEAMEQADLDVEAGTAAAAAARQSDLLAVFEHYCTIPTAEEGATGVVKLTSWRALLRDCGIVRGAKDLRQADTLFVKAQRDVGPPGDRNMTFTVFVHALALVALWKKPVKGEDDERGARASVHALRAQLRHARRAQISESVPELDSKAVEDAILEVEPALRRLYFHYCEKQHGWTMSFAKFRSLCGDFNIFPSLLGDGAVLRVFRCISPDLLAITYPGYVRVMARAALAGFSQPGLEDEFPLPEDRIRALVDRVLAETERLDRMRMREHRSGQRNPLKLLPAAVLMGEHYTGRRAVSKMGVAVKGAKGLGAANLLTSPAGVIKSRGHFGGGSILGSVGDESTASSSDAKGLASADDVQEAALNRARQRRVSAVTRGALTTGEDGPVVVTSDHRGSLVPFSSASPPAKVSSVGIGSPPSTSGFSRRSIVQSLGAPASMTSPHLKLTAQGMRRRRLSLEGTPSKPDDRQQAVATPSGHPPRASSVASLSKSQLGASTPGGSRAAVDTAARSLSARRRSTLAASESVSPRFASTASESTTSAEAVESTPVDASLSLRSLVHPDAVTHVMKQLVPGFADIVPVFLFYCRIDEPGNHGFMDIKAFLRLLRDVGALDDAVTPGMVHLQFVEALRSQHGGTVPPSCIKAAEQLGFAVSGEAVGVGSESSPRQVASSSERKVRRRTHVQASGAGERVGLVAFVEALVRVSELIREATQTLYRSQQRGRAVEAAGSSPSRGFDAAKERARAEEAAARERRRLFGGAARASGDLPLSDSEKEDSLVWARSLLTKRIIPLGSLALEESKAVNALASAGIFEEIVDSRELFLLLFGEFASEPSAPEAGPELRLAGFMDMLHLLEIVPKLVGRRDAEVVFHAAARRGGTDAATFFGTVSIQAELAKSKALGFHRGIKVSTDGADGSPGHESFITFPFFLEALCLIGLRAYAHSGRTLPTAADRIATFVTWIRASSSLGELESQARVRGHGYGGRLLTVVDLLGGPRAMKRSRVDNESSAPAASSSSRESLFLPLAYGVKESRRALQKLQEEEAKQEQGSPSRKRRSSIARAVINSVTQEDAGHDGRTEEHRDWLEHHGGGVHKSPLVMEALGIVGAVEQSGQSVVVSALRTLLQSLEDEDEVAEFEDEVEGVATALATHRRLPATIAAKTIECTKRIIKLCLPTEEAASKPNEVVSRHLKLLIPHIEERARSSNPPPTAASPPPSHEKPSPPRVQFAASPPPPPPPRRKPAPPVVQPPKGEADADTVSSVVGALTLSKSFVVKQGDASRGDMTRGRSMVAGSGQHQSHSRSSSERSVTFSPTLKTFVSFSSPHADLPLASQHAAFAPSDSELALSQPGAPPGDGGPAAAFDPHTTLPRQASAREHRVRAAAQVYGKLGRQRSVRFRKTAERAKAQAVAEALDEDEAAEEVSDLDAMLGGPVGGRSSSVGARGARERAERVHQLVQFRRENEFQAERLLDRNRAAVVEARWSVGLRSNLKSTTDWGHAKAWRGKLGVRRSASAEGARRSRRGSVTMGPGTMTQEALTRTILTVYDGPVKADPGAFHVPVVAYLPHYVATPATPPGLDPSEVPPVVLSPQSRLRVGSDLVDTAHTLSPSSAALAAIANSTEGGERHKRFFPRDSGALTAQDLLKTIGDASKEGGVLDGRSVLQIAKIREKRGRHPVFTPGELQHVHRQAAGRTIRTAQAWGKEFRGGLGDSTWGARRSDGKPLGAPVSPHRLVESHLTLPVSPKWAARKETTSYRDNWPSKQARTELMAMLSRSPPGVPRPAPKQAPVSERRLRQAARAETGSPPPPPPPPLTTTTTHPSQQQSPAVDEKKPLSPSDLATEAMDDVSRRDLEEQVGIQDMSLEAQAHMDAARLLAEHRAILEASHGVAARETPSPHRPVRLDEQFDALDSRGFAEAYEMY
jgi:hypothetical protein